MKQKRTNSTNTTEGSGSITEINPSSSVASLKPIQNFQCVQKPPEISIILNLAEFNHHCSASYSRTKHEQNQQLIAHKNDRINKQRHACIERKEHSPAVLAASWKADSCASLPAS